MARPKPEANRASQRKYRERHPDRVKSRSKIWREANRERLRKYDQNSKSLKNYGITLEQKLARIAAQDGRCAICGTTEPGGKWSSFCTDHDHITGKLRGELCSKCNTAIGLLKDDAGLLRAALAYIERYKTWLPQ